ncbi:endonuclease Q family protein [archaeon]
MFYADLHIHGPHSRGTSKALSVENLEKYARIKGIDLLGTGDFTHPIWLQSLKDNLSGEGVLKTKTGFPFVLQTEISSIYSQGGKTRKIHQVILAPSFEVVDQINGELLKRGRLDYDGRPIFGMPAPDIVELVMSIDPMCEVIPAHIWTPWFSLFGSNSGFDSIKECYSDQIKHIHAIETGLSSDPEMNWRLSQLDDFSIVSFSDLHSFWPWRIGREATQLDCAQDYSSIINAIRKNKIASTVEVDPNYGKYHLDGHRNCNVVLTPDEAKKHNNVCPKCNKPLTIGVLHRVEELADRPEGYSPKNRPGFKTFLPLSEIIAAVSDHGIATKAVWQYYDSLVSGTSEMNVLTEMPEEELKKRTHEKIAAAILKNRAGAVEVKGGYDGVYGEAQLDVIARQKKLGDY